MLHLFGEARSASSEAAPFGVSMDGWKTAWSKDQAVFLCALGFLLPPQNRASDFPEVNRIYGARCCFFP